MPVGFTNEPRNTLCRKFTSARRIATASVTVTNAGPVAGKHVVQAYVATGDYTVQIGHSAADIVAEAAITLAGRDRHAGCPTTPSPK